jgi:hypothetical protein
MTSIAAPIYNNNWFGSAALTGILNDKPEEAVSKALTEADKILKSKIKKGKEENGCRNFLMDKLGLTSEQIDKITDNVRNAPTTFPGPGTSSVLMSSVPEYSIPKAG